MTARCAACGLDVYDGGELCPICQSDPPPGYEESTQSAAGRASTGNGTKQPTTELVRRARAAIRKHGGLRAAGRALDCNHGIIGLAADGEDFPAARRVFGLPPKAVEVEPCPDCGEVHETKTTCTHELERRRKRKTDVFTLAFRFRSRADFEAARAAVDAHPGGRSDWLLDRVEEDR